jgi:hypothetical protein
MWETDLGGESPLEVNARLGPLCRRHRRGNSLIAAFDKGLRAAAIIVSRTKNKDRHSRQRGNKCLHGSALLESDELQRPPADLEITGGLPRRTI